MRDRGEKEEGEKERCIYNIIAPDGGCNGN